MNMNRRYRAGLALGRLVRRPLALARDVVSVAWGLTLFAIGLAVIWYAWAFFGWVAAFFTAWMVYIVVEVRDEARHIREQGERAAASAAARDKYYSFQRAQLEMDVMIEASTTNPETKS